MTDFDPYQELMHQKVLVTQLVSGHNHHDKILVDVTEQFAMMADLVRHLEQRITDLERR